MLKTLYNLKAERKAFEDFLKKDVTHFGPKTPLRDACEYALLNGGKRIRPLIVMEVAKALGAKHAVLDAALSVEFFHTASLIADDMPCMDDDDFRREKPSLHKEFDEATALLASYTLIAAGYQKIHTGAMNLPFGMTARGERALGALELASECAGIEGATGGQYRDLYDSSRDLNAIEQIIYQKTITLFEIAFGFGWIFGGGDLERLGDLRKAAYHFGLAFQLGDDLIDLDQDGADNTYVNVAGIEATFSLFQKELEGGKKALKDLGLLSEGFSVMFELVERRVKPPLIPQR